MAASGEFVAMKDLKLGFIGAGNMSQAVIKGIIKSGLVKADDIMGSALSDSTYNKLKALGMRTSRYNADVVSFATVVVLGVKPHQIMSVLKELEGVMTSDKLVVSIAAGVTLDAMEKALPAGTPVIRVMPSLPAEVACGTSAICVGSSADQAHTDLTCSLFRPCGFVEVMPEKYIDIVGATCAAMIGCVTVEAMADGAVKMGLPRGMAQRLCAQSLMGAAKLVLESGQHPAAIKDGVCSPGGATIRALHKLEAGGYRSALIDAIEAATLRCRELGN